MPTLFHHYFHVFINKLSTFRLGKPFRIIFLVKRLDSCTNHLRRETMIFAKILRNAAAKKLAKTETKNNLGGSWQICRKVFAATRNSAEICARLSSFYFGDVLLHSPSLCCQHDHHPHYQHQHNHHHRQNHHHHIFSIIT